MGRAFNAGELSGRFGVKARKELVRCTLDFLQPFGAHPLSPHGVRRWRSPVTCAPFERRCHQLDSFSLTVRSWDPREILPAQRSYERQNQFLAILSA